MNGSLSTPRTGVGHCNNGTPDALTQNGGAVVTGGIVQLPQAVSLPLPPPPNPLPPTSSIHIQGGDTCGSLSGCSNGVPSGLTFAPGTYGNISLTSGATLHLSAGTYTVNSLSLSGNSSLVIDSGPVILNVAGQNQNAPVDLTGGTLVNASLVASNLQITYAGTNSLKLAGGSQSAALVYAPAASAELTGAPALRFDPITVPDDYLIASGGGECRGSSTDAKASAHEYQHRRLVLVGRSFSFG